MKKLLSALSILLFLGWAASASAATAIYYSVGTNAAALYSANASASSGTLTLASAAANNIGVGDEVRVGSNRYYITGRSSSTVFTIQNSKANGGTPGDTAITFASTAITIYRAYVSLFAAEAGASDASHLNTLGLVAGNYQLNFPCYADGVDSANVYVDGWTTGASNYIRIYTPVLASEVGVTQRHNGTWGTGYQRTSILRVEDNYVRLDGISIKQSTDGEQAFYYYNIPAANAEYHLSNCFSWINDQGTTHKDCYDFHTTAAASVAKVWNNICYNNSVYSESYGFIFNDVDWTIYGYNNTAIVNGGNAFRNGDTAVSTNINLKNCLGVSSSAAAFSVYSGSMNVAYSASDDATADDWGGTGNRISQTFSFRDAANFDYHLAATDAGARDYGTNLSADANLPFAIDVDGDPRPLGSSWDIGADEAQYQGSASLMGMEF